MPIKKGEYMSEKITTELIYKLDNKYAIAGIPFSERPLKAMIDIFGPQSALEVFGNSDFIKLVDLYEKTIKEATSTWSGMGTGLVASMDQVKAFTVGVNYNAALTHAQMLSFSSDEELFNWCRKDQEIVNASLLAFTDIYDLTYGVNELIQRETVSKDVREYLLNAMSNIGDVAHILANSDGSSSVSQPIGLAAELAMKAVLCHSGVPIKELRSQSLGHKYQKIADCLISIYKHRDDELVKIIAGKLPDYVNSRYVDAKLSRIQLVKLALGTQFIAASAIRRISNQDLALELENDAPTLSSSRKKFASSFIGDEWLPK